MDRFSEQLIKKESDGKDMMIRGLIIAGEILVIFLLVMFCLLFQLQPIMLCVALFIGSIWGVKYLMEGTIIEYEYIVTNDDLDIDKIIGMRKRKRLITVSLRTVTEIAPYSSDTDLNADVTVVAHDNTGEDMWYIIADTDNYGRLAVIFNANETTRENIIGGFEPSLRAKYKKEN